MMRFRDWDEDEPHRTVRRLTIAAWNTLRYGALYWALAYRDQPKQGWWCLKNEASWMEPQRTHNRQPRHWTAKQVRALWRWARQRVREA